MSRYILGRFIQMIPVLFGVLLAVFILTHVLPGDPVLLMLGEDYTETEYQEM
ncbi:MAG: ABC transporter permease, partial [Deltaproteobacteria bacterium]|nr:ABC transporter permease [Deltaproteobacteria bacterium]